MNTLAQLLGREKIDVKLRDLPRSVITHEAIAELRYENLVEDAPVFREHTVEDAPTVVTTKAPEPVDPLTATPEQLTKYREDVEAYRLIERDAKPYTSWAELVADVFYSYYSQDEPKILDKVDTGVELHREIMRQVLASDEHTEAREHTRRDDVLSAYATMRFVDKLKEVLGEQLETQMREAQELEERRKEIEETEVEIDNILPAPDPQAEAPEAEPQPEGEPEGGGEGGAPAPAPPQDGTAQAGGDPNAPQPKVKLTDKAKKQLDELRERQARAEAEAEALAEPKIMGADAQKGITEAAQEGEEAATEGARRPRFGTGVGGSDEPTYTSPEQALEVMKRYCEDPELRQMMEMFGRVRYEFRYKRSKRVEGGNDEIIDVKMGDDLRRTIPAEMALLSDPELEDDFFARYVSKELLEYKTVGEERAGRGPVVIVLDGSGSMEGQRNIYARAIALAVLQTCRIERRDFALVEFSNNVAEWHFLKREPLNGDKVLDMASHFFGQGTVPIMGMQRAAALMRSAGEFSKADIVLVGDGDGGFGPEDTKLRDEMRDKGVRFFGICVAGSWEYIKKYCEPDGYVVDVHDFATTEPGEATAMLAEHMT